MKENFTKSNLQTGMIITQRGGKEYVIFLNAKIDINKKYKDFYINIKDGVWGLLNYVNEDLTSQVGMNMTL